MGAIRRHSLFLEEVGTIDLTSRVLSWIGKLRFRPVLPVTFLVLLLAALLGTHASPFILGLLVAVEGGIILLQQPILGLLALVTAALVIPLEFGTGSAVVVNAAALLVPALLGVWMLSMVRRKEVRLAPSRTNRPLMFFLLAGLLSLLVGNVIWDPLVPRSGDFIIVQLAQWAIFAFSAGAFWLTGNLVRDEVWLRRLTFLFLALAGSLAILHVTPGTSNLTERIATYGLHRPPFRMLLAALAGGQLFFNEELSARWRLFLLASLGAVLFYAFVLWRATASNWISVGAVLSVLAWLRFPRLRWPVVAVFLVLTVSGIFTSATYNFAGGDDEWEESGGSRLALIGRVVEVTMRNPVTGLGPAAYRPYARLKPLAYGGAFYDYPPVSSHNNYVDLFSHVGLLGLIIFFWFTAEATMLGIRLRAHFTQGFPAGYVNAMLAAWAGALVLMLFADWLLPFVYNIGFPGFQASVLVWLFLGGEVTLEQMAVRESGG